MDSLRTSSVASRARSSLLLHANNATATNAKAGMDFGNVIID
jgi:hypothetical protein